MIIGKVACCLLRSEVDCALDWPVLMCRHCVINAVAHATEVDCYVTLLRKCLMMIYVLILTNVPTFVIVVAVSTGERKQPHPSCIGVR